VVVVMYPLTVAVADPTWHRRSSPGCICGYICYFVLLDTADAISER
jgi:hypothetical protein